jgi:hypothetical protein
MSTAIVIFFVTAVSSQLYHKHKIKILVALPEINNNYLNNWVICLELEKDDVY